MFTIRIAAEAVHLQTLMLNFLDCATKWAVEALAIALRNETCKEGIRVATINPGLVETEIVKSNVQSELQAIEATPDELKCKYARFFVDFNKQVCNQ